MISAKIIGDSINPKGSRLTTFILTYPRFVHSEFMTHRAFSRNAASSRAIPFHKMVELVETNTARPEHWGAEQKGMQSGGVINNPQRSEDLWMMAGAGAVSFAEQIVKETGVHKSIANRIIEPWSHITVVATATAPGLENFFSLRAHPAAQPEFQVLAYRMLSEYLKSQPKPIDFGGWHIPSFGRYIPDGRIELNEDMTSRVVDTYSPEQKIQIATARCARLSYLTFDGEYSPEKDIALHDSLAKAGHWSPFEHCAQAVDRIKPSETSNFDVGYELGIRTMPFAEICGGSGWRQYRKQFDNECQTADLPALLAAKPDWVTL